VQTSACSGPVTITPLIRKDVASVVAGVAGVTDLRTQVTVGTATFVFQGVDVSNPPLTACRYNGAGSTDTADQIQYLFYRNHDNSNINMMLVEFKATGTGGMTVQGIDFGTIGGGVTGADCADALEKWKNKGTGGWSPWCNDEATCGQSSPGIKNIQLLTAPTCAAPPSPSCDFTTPHEYSPMLTTTPVAFPGVTLSSLDEISVGTAVPLGGFIYVVPEMKACLRNTPSNTPTHRQYIFYLNGNYANEGYVEMVMVNFQVTGGQLFLSVENDGMKFKGPNPAFLPPNEATCADVVTYFEDTDATVTVVPVATCPSGPSCNGYNVKQVKVFPCTLAPPPPPSCDFTVPHEYSPLLSGSPVAFPGITVNNLDEISVGTALPTGQYISYASEMKSCLRTSASNSPTYREFIFYLNTADYGGFVEMVLVKFQVTGGQLFLSVDPVDSSGMRYQGPGTLYIPASNCADVNTYFESPSHQAGPTPMATCPTCAGYNVKQVKVLTCPPPAPVACGTFADVVPSSPTAVPGVLVSSLDQVSVGSLTIVDHPAGNTEFAPAGICDSFQPGATWLYDASKDTRLSRQWLTYYNTATTTKMVIFWLIIENGQLKLDSYYSMEYRQGTTTNCADAKVRWEQGVHPTDYGFTYDRYTIKNVQIMCNAPVSSPVVAPIFAPSSRPSPKPTFKPTTAIPSSAPVLSPIVAADFVQTIAKPLTGVLTVDLNLIRITGASFSYFGSIAIKVFDVVPGFCEVNNAPGFPEAPPTDAFNKYYIFHYVFAGVANLIYVRLELRASGQVWVSGKSAAVNYGYGYTCPKAVIGWSTAKPTAIPPALNNVVPSATAKGYSLNQIGFAWSSRSPTLAPIASVAPTYSLAPTYAPTYVPTLAPTLPKAATSFITASWVAIPAMSGITSLDQMSVKSLFMGGKGVTATGQNLNAMVCRLPQAVPNTNLGRTFITAIRDGTTTKIASFELKIDTGKVWVRTPVESTGRTQTGNTFIVYSAGSTPYALPSDCKTLIGYWNTMAQVPIATCANCANYGVRAIAFTDARNGYIAEGKFTFFAGITGRRRLTTTSVASIDADGSSQAIFKAIGAMLHVSPALMEMKSVEVDSFGAVNVVVQYSAFLDDFSGIGSLTDLLASLTATAYDKVYSGAFLTSLQALSPVGSFAKSIQESAVEMSETFFQLSEMTQAPTFLPTAAPTFAPTDVPSFKPTKKLKTHKPNNGKKSDHDSDDDGTGSDADGRRLRYR
jgi:hypothetical protein